MAEPFKIFFKFGWLMFILFLGVWPYYSFFHAVSYPGSFHVQGIVSLAVGSFAIGFLLTALPRFTGTKPAGLGVVSILLGLSFAELAFLFLNESSWASLCLAFKFFTLLTFAFPRFLKRQNPLPPSFVWIGFGLFFALVGGIGSFFSPNPFFTSLLTQGFMTSLFVGVGGRLIPFLTGIADSPLTQGKTFPAETKLHSFLALLFGLALVLQGTSNYLQTALFLKAFVLAFEIAVLWRLYKKPHFTARAVLLWIASWLLPLTELTSGFFPAWRLHIEHGLFIGTFLLGTIVVASHVIVSHQNLNQKLLKKYNPLGLVGVLVLFAALTRIMAPLLTYEKHLGYAGLVATSALVYWGFYFFLSRSVFKPNYEEC